MWSFRCYNNIIINIYALESAHTVTNFVTQNNEYILVWHGSKIYTIIVQVPLNIIKDKIYK